MIGNMKQTLHKMCAKEQGNKGKSTSHWSCTRQVYHTLCRVKSWHIKVKHIIGSEYYSVDIKFKISGDWIDKI